MKKTYIVRYDLFPYYSVIEGEPMEFLGVNKIMSIGLGIYSPENVLAEFGVEMYEDLEKERRMLERKYDEGIIQLQKDLLSDSSIAIFMEHKIKE